MFFCFFFVVVLFPGFISLLSLSQFMHWSRYFIDSFVHKKVTLAMADIGFKRKDKWSKLKKLNKRLNQHKVKCKFINIIIKITPSVSSSLDWARWAGFLRGFHDIFTYVLFNKKNPQKLNNYIKDYMLFTFRPKTPQFLKNISRYLSYNVP